MSEAASAADDRGTALPLVAGNGGNVGIWIFGVGLAIAAALLFYGLESRRSALSSPNVTVPAESSGGRIASPPELIIPEFGEAEPEFALVIPRRAPPGPAFQVPQPEPVQRIRTAEPPPEEEYVDPAPVRQITRPRPQTDFSPPAQREAAEEFLPEPTDAERKFLVRFDNPSTTIPKGTVIHAVLESALDSTRPGSVRAIVSREVSSFDGTRVLIPKGSRLLGNYEADLARGQKRALIQWTRLMLPEGIIMELDSPSADPLGRAGVRGKVNSHFFARFGDALMRSILDTGVQLAGREIGGDTVIVNVPNATQIDGGTSTTFQPTLKVKHGTSVSVFVAHDLDFSDRFRERR